MRVSLSVFVSIFADNKFKDLNESKLSNMIEKIKLQLICIIENIVLHVGIHRTEMCRKQPPKNKQFVHFWLWF